jgi:hypothetical protein
VKGVPLREFFLVSNAGDRQNPFTMKMVDCHTRSGTRSTDLMAANLTFQDIAKSANTYHYHSA